MCNISLSTFQRLPIYLNYLKSLKEVEYISSKQIANVLMYGEVQVRKDLASVCDSGKPKIGHKVCDLIVALERVLGCNNGTKAIIVGVGKLGQTLLGYKGFSDYGLAIVAGFDERKDIISSSPEIPVFHVSQLANFIKGSDVSLAILTTPASVAQEVADILMDNGIKGIWNFAPKRLVAKEGVVIKDENLAASLAMLSGQIKE